LEAFESFFQNELVHNYRFKDMHFQAIYVLLKIFKSRRINIMKYLHKFLDFFFNFSTMIVQVLQFFLKVFGKFSNYREVTLIIFELLLVAYSKCLLILKVIVNTGLNLKRFWEKRYSLPAFCFSKKLVFLKKVDTFF
jgi:hypothetical protein